MSRHIPTYEDFTEGKKLTAKQHFAKQKKYNELYGEKEEVLVDGKKPGRCECGSGSFLLRVEKHKMYRTCKSCSDRIEV